MEAKKQKIESLKSQRQQDSFDIDSNSSFDYCLWKDDQIVSHFKAPQFKTLLDFGDNEVSRMSAMEVQLDPINEGEYSLNESNSLFFNFENVLYFNSS